MRKAMVAAVALTMLAAGCSGPSEPSGNAQPRAESPTASAGTSSVNPSPSDSEPGASGSPASDLPTTEPDAYGDIYRDRQPDANAEPDANGDLYVPRKQRNGEHATSHLPPGTKGTRLVDGLGASTPSIALYYDDVYEDAPR